MTTSATFPWMLTETDVGHHHRRMVRRNPALAGESGNYEWKVHDIDACGCIETIRFFDIDSCGCPEIFQTHPWGRRPTIS